MTLKDGGVAGRGVLLDVPRALDCRGSSIRPTGSPSASLERTEQAQGVKVGIGDILLVTAPAATFAVEGTDDQRVHRGPGSGHEGHALVA